MSPFIVKPYSWLVKAGDFSQILLLLFFRLNWGWLFFVSGKGKLLHHPDIVDFSPAYICPFLMKQHGSLPW